MPGRFGDRIRLLHLLDAIRAIEGYTENADFQIFSSNLMMQDACVRQLQVIGESCRNVSLDLRKNNPEVPWRQIIGLRIIVIHQYFGIDPKVIWEIIRNDLPALKTHVNLIIETL